jgi:hypothetical protein
MNYNTRYNRRAYSSANPGFLIFLVNQGCGDEQQAINIAHIVNRTIDRIIQTNCDGPIPKDRCFISVIGYNHNVKELCSGWLKELDENPLRYEIFKRKFPDGAGGIIEIEVKQPVWVEPITQDGATNMLGALSLARDLAEEWITYNPDGPAPIIINISDGVLFYEGKDSHLYLQESITMADKIKILSNENENVLLLNAVLSPLSEAQKIREKYLRVDNSAAKISSDIPVELMNELERLLLIHNLDLSFFSSMKSWYVYGDTQQANVFLNLVTDILFSHIAGEVGQ